MRRILILALLLAAGTAHAQLGNKGYEPPGSGGSSGSAITGLTGDVTATGPGVVPGTLATVNSNVGTYQGLTINQKGLVTAAGAGEVDLGSQMLTQSVANSSGTGTATGLLAKLTSTGARTITTSDTKIGNLIGVCVSGCGTTGSATVATNGTVQAQFDNSTTAGDYVVASTTSAGKVHDAGSTLPTGVNVLGFADTTNVGAGTYGLNINAVGVASGAITNIPVGANPTATVGGTAVNGSATTFMRSDAAPALTSGTLTKAVSWDSGTTVTAATVPLFVPNLSGTIDSVTYYVASGGSFTMGIQINGSNVTSCNGISVSSSSATTTTCTAANTFSSGNRIEVVTSSITSAPVQALVQINYH